MKINIITSNIELEEIGRIKTESEKAGHEVSVVDFSGFHYSYVDGKVSFFPEIPDADVAIIRGMFSAARSVEPLGQYLKSLGIKVFDNNLFSHKYSINKVFDITKLIFSGVNVPDYYHSRTYAGLFDYAKTMKYPAIIKTAGTGKGAEIYMIENVSEMAEVLKKRQDKGVRPRKIVIQNFVDYKYDLRVLVIGERMYCMRRIPKKGDFRANFSLGGSVELFQITPEIRDLTRRAIKSIGLEVAGVDILIDKKGKLYILEVNHTPGMIGMEEATGENISKIYLDYAIAHARKLE